METTFNKALIAQQEGKIDEAENLYRDILKIEPTNLHANHNLGVIELSKNNAEIASLLFKKTITIKPDYVEAYSNLGVTLEKLSRFEEAEKVYKKAIELKPDYAEAHFNLGNTLKALKKMDEAEKVYKKAIKLKPNYAEIYYNLGRILEDLGRLNESVASFKKAIENKPKYFEAYNNLGNISKKLDKLDDAEKNYKKAIELNPKFSIAYNNLGSILADYGKLEESELILKKAIELNPDLIDAHNNLGVVLKKKRLLFKISQVKNVKKKNRESATFEINPNLNQKLTSNPFISYRKVEPEIINDLYKMNSTKLDETPDIRYGNGRCSDYELFENNYPSLKRVEEDLTNIMMQAVKSEVFIMESFFNILRKGSGLTSHRHLNNFDKFLRLDIQKYSLTYYLSVGDQACSEPGILTLENPIKKILPSEGTIVIFPASRWHSAVYGGNIDRLMIGINFYSLI